MKNFLINDKELQGRDWLIDGAIMLAALAFGCLQLVLSSSSIIIADPAFRQMIGVINTSPTLPAYAAMAVTTVPLLLRRQYSWPVFVFVLGAFLFFQEAFQGYSFTMIGPVIALYTIARERGRNEAIIATFIASMVMIFGLAPAQNVSLSLFFRLQNVSFLILAALAGFAIRTHQEYLVEVEQRALAAERSREEEAARRVEEERVRIAREIHDITAHSLSAVSIQAAAAERLVMKDPQAAEEAIKMVRVTAKDALEEIRSMIGILRQGDSTVEMAPIQGTERMGDLVSYLEGAGISVSYSDETYDRSKIPSYIDIALFGIAREAVTNIVRHAQAHLVHLELRLDYEKAYLVVEDDGVGSKGVTQQQSDSLSYQNSSASIEEQLVPKAVQQAEVVREMQEIQQANLKQQSGHGIQGMRERVYVLGGTIDIGDRAEGGFSVCVAIPLGEAGKYHE